METETRLRHSPVLLTPLSDADIAEVREVYSRGLFVQALKAAERIRPLKQWRGTDAQLIAARVADNLGGGRLANLLRFRAWRSERSHAEAIYYYARMLFRTMHPLRAWQFMREQGDLPNGPTDVRADWMAFVATTYARIRDFDTAHEWMEKAKSLVSDRAWITSKRLSASARRPL